LVEDEPYWLSPASVPQSRDYGEPWASAWQGIAVDRFDGTIVGQQLEEVVE
jgi:hypothetical protein